MRGLARTAAWLLTTMAAGLCLAALVLPAPAAAGAPSAICAAPPDAAACGWATGGASSFGWLPGTAPVPALQSVGDGVSEVRFPSRFDLRQRGRVSPVRNQGKLGTCWAFAALASLESTFDKRVDLSEDNMVLRSGFDGAPYSTGGNWDMAAAYLLGGRGPVAESADPYGDGTSPRRADVASDVRTVLWLPERRGSADNAAIKEALTRYGVVAVTMRWVPGAYRASTASYCSQGYGFPNHAVDIVGWDDDYPRAAFSPAAPGDGAFIVRNSWGRGWGRGGYFSVSYYDSSIAHSGAVFVAGRPPAKDARTYQYDPLGQTLQVGLFTPTAWFANVFRAVSDGTVGSAGFYCPVPDSGFAVYAGPSLQELTKVAEGSERWAGYHEERFQTPLAVARGSRFVVAVRLTTPGFDYPVAIEARLRDRSSQARSERGQSFWSGDGVHWGDITEHFPDANVCLKAYSVDTRAPDPSPTPTPASAASAAPATASPDN